MDIVENMVTNSYQWPAKRTIMKRVTTTSNYDLITLLASQLAALTTDIKEIKVMVQTQIESISDELILEDAYFVKNINFGNFQRGN